MRAVNLGRAQLTGSDVVSQDAVEHGSVRLELIDRGSGKLVEGGVIGANTVNWPLLRVSTRFTFELSCPKGLW